MIRYRLGTSWMLGLSSLISFSYAESPATLLFFFSRWPWPFPYALVTGKGEAANSQKAGEAGPVGGGRSMSDP